MKSTTLNVPNRTIFTGDNIEVMRGINSDSADLIYLDPPFNSNRTYSAPIGSRAAGAAFKDSWTLDDVDHAWHGEIADREPALYTIIEGAKLAHSKGMAAYLIMMAVRMLELRRVLKPDGSIYLHCDPTASHYLKALMDCVFGRDAFRNEIVWSYQRWTGASKRFQRMHDTILFYAGQEAEFNIQYEPYSAKSAHKGSRRSVHRDGKLSQSYTGDTLRKKSMRDVWEISYLNSQAKERCGYPTQKPLALLERIIRASSNAGDVVFDPFCGCATSLIAAERLDRNWLGCDLSSMAIRLVRQRLEKECGGLICDVTHREDIPQRTDQGKIPHYREQKHVLYGQQEGICWGCLMHFPFRNLTVDHKIPQAHGGSDHITNLQLLCQACNSMKGIGSHTALVAKLIKAGIRPAPEKAA